MKILIYFSANEISRGNCRATLDVLPRVLAVSATIAALCTARKCALSQVSGQRIPCVYQ